MFGNFLHLEFDQQDNFQMLLLMLLLTVVGMQLKYELNELAITSGSLIMMPISLMKVLDDLRFLPRMVLMWATFSYCFQKNSQEDCDNTVFWQFGLL